MVSQVSSKDQNAKNIRLVRKPFYFYKVCDFHDKREQKSLASTQEYFESAEIHSNLTP